MRNLDSNFNSKTISPRYADRLPGGEMVVTDSGLLQGHSEKCAPNSNPATKSFHRTNPFCV